MIEVRRRGREVGFGRARAALHTAGKMGDLDLQAGGAVSLRELLDPEAQLLVGEPA